MHDDGNGNDLAITIAQLFLQKRQAKNECWTSSFKKLNRLKVILQNNITYYKISKKVSYNV